MFKAPKHSELQIMWAEYVNNCCTYAPPDRRHAFIEGVLAGIRLANADVTQVAKVVWDTNSSTVLEWDKTIPKLPLGTEVYVFQAATKNN